MELINAKGMKDYLPNEMIVLNEIMYKLKTSFERAGYAPLSTPVIENMDVLTAKYAGGNEILKETFKLSDQGGRKLGLRYDLTVPFARVIGKNQQIKFPFKRYQMEKVYRDGPIGPGRYREFWQCDIDVVGSNNMKAEAELLSIAENFFLELGLNPEININNRKITDAIFKQFKIKDKDRTILTIDKLEKIGKEEVIKELEKNGEEEVENLINYLETLDDLENIEKLIGVNEGISEIKELLKFCNYYELKKIKFNPLLARGLSYYTGTVFEIKLTGNKIKSTVTAGGRYDRMIGDFLQSKQQYPAVGISFGLSRIFDALLSDKKIKLKKTTTQAIIITFSDEETEYSIKTLMKLRKAGINTEIDIMNRKMRKNLDYANTMGIDFAIIIGENEVKNKTISLKDLESGEQTELTIENAIDKIKSKI